MKSGADEILKSAKHTTKQEILAEHAKRKLPAEDKGKNKEDGDEGTSSKHQKFEQEIEILVTLSSETCDLVDSSRFWTGSGGDCLDTD